MRKPIPISELLAQGKSRLQNLQAGVESANRVLAAVRRALPAGLGEQVFGASVGEDGQLTVLVASGAYATRVRYELPALLGTIEQEAGGGPIRRAQVRVRPATGP